MAAPGRRRGRGRPRRPPAPPSPPPRRPAKIARSERLEVASRAPGPASSGSSRLAAVEQQRRRVAAAPAGERDLGAQPVQPRALQLVERAQLRDGEQLQRGVGRAGVELGLRRGQRPRAPRRRVGRQLGRPLQERGRRRDAAAGLGPAGRALELGGDRLVGSRRRVGAMPRPAVGVELRVGRLGQRAVHLRRSPRRRRAVGRRAHQRMPEPHPCAELDQPRRLGRRRRVAPDPEPLGRAPQQRRVADRLGRRRAAAAAACSAGSGSSRRRKLCSIRLGERQRVGQPEPARQLRRRQPARQLQQRQRVAARLGDDPVAHPLVQRSR